MSTDDEIQKEEPIDTEERVIAALKSLLLPSDSPSLIGMTLDTFLIPPEPCPEEDLARMKNRIVEKILADLHPKPARRLETPMSFGQCLKRTRELVHLHAGNIALFLGKTASYVKDIETGKTPPWQLDPEEMATLALLFRIHADLLRKLVISSIAVSQGRAEKERAIEKASPGIRKQLRRKSSDAEESDDELYAHLGKGEPMPKDIEKWFKRVIKALKDRKAMSFIK